ncbi:MAG: homocysteine S-methyltransferase family protein [Pseudomonadota bacterium]|nr:homocysteine S-methyltransferase family protein [Pseudomonadota bacterium]
MKFTIMDGGMGRQLQRSGAPFRQPEWSALALMEDPSYIRKVHNVFIEAGAEIITTNSYAVVPFHIGDHRFAERGEELLTSAGMIAREAANGADVTVAGSVPPVFGSYITSGFDATEAKAILGLFRDYLLPHVDIALAETISTYTEAVAFLDVFESCGKPVWLGISVEDLQHEPGQPKLRSGEQLDAIFRLVKDRGVDALLFNCSKPEAMGDAVERAGEVLTDLCPIGVLPNAFAGIDTGCFSNETLNQIRPDLTPSVYGRFVDAWLDMGASIVGGCCGIGPEHIAELKCIKSKVAD